MTKKKKTPRVCHYISELGSPESFFCQLHPRKKQKVEELIFFEEYEYYSLCVRSHFKLCF